MEWYNPETETRDTYTKVQKLEVLTARDGTKVIINGHYWEDPYGELWVNPNDPNENLRVFASEYRKQKGFMQPDEIRELRSKLGYSERGFAFKLGISYAKLSAIENNKRIQTLYQENLFRKAQSDLAFYGHLVTGKTRENASDALTNYVKRHLGSNIMKEIGLYSTAEPENSRNFSALQSSGGTI